MRVFGGSWQSEEEEEEEEETQASDGEPSKGFRRFCFARLEPGSSPAAVSVLPQDGWQPPLRARAAALAVLGIAVTLLYPTPLGNLFACLLVRRVTRSRDLSKPETDLGLLFLLLILLFAFDTRRGQRGRGRGRR